MTQLKILNYAQAAAMDKWWLYDELADKFAGEKAGERARNMANEIMNDVKEIGVMIDAEEKRLRAEAEKQRKQEQAARAQQAQPKAPQPQQERPTAGRIVDDGTKWTVAVRYKDGSETVSRFSHENIARKAYETIRMLDRGIAESNLSRMTLTHKNAVVKAYERD
jgi:hypothetical protein